VDECFAPEGLIYSDDDAYLFEVESDDEFRTSFPKDVVRKNIIPGNPTKPDVRNMTEATAKIVLKEYAKEGKAYTDKQVLHMSRQFSLFLFCPGFQVTTMSNYEP